MTDTIPLRGSSNPEGLRAAAQILRAAGPGAELVFAQLTPDEARAIHATMDDPSAHPTNEDRSALEAFLLETAEDPRSRPERPENSVWAKLTKTHAPILAALANRESPQVAAWMISRLDPHLAANVVRVLSDEVSLSILKRILNAKTPPKPVCDLIETTLETTLSRIGPELQVDGHATVARIFDQLDEDATLLAKLDQSTPGAADRVRALMFTFEDLVVLDAAGMQTLIA
ncbi:MAG: FliG C-terminal domain-containing protein, partial [Pseudomonadota bacterium]